MENTFNIWMIILPFAFVIIFFGIMILFARQSTRHKIQRWWHSNKSLDVFIIKDNHFIINGVVGTHIREFMFEGQKYIVDEEAIVFEKSKLGQKPVAFYFEGNPSPIKFHNSKIDTKFSGEELNKWAQSQFIKQLLDTTSEKLIPILLILVVIGIIVSAIGIYMTTKGQAEITGLLHNLTIILRPVGITTR
jgi:uncharacterized membrane protein